METSAPACLKLSVLRSSATLNANKTCQSGERGFVGVQCRSLRSRWSVARLRQPRAKRALPTRAATTLVYITQFLQRRNGGIEGCETNSFGMEGDGIRGLTTQANLRPD